MKSRIPLLFLGIGAALAALATRAFAFEALYEKTEVGKIELKSLPERTVLRTTHAGSYFEEDNRLFSTLFNYIKKNDVAMTVPVEAEVDTAEMRFFAGGKDAKRDLADNRSVTVETIRSREVLSIGLAGAYSESLYDLGKKQLEEWMAAHPEYRAVAPAYAVYWNGPYVPNLWKRSEVHLPVTKIEADLTAVVP